MSRTGQGNFIVKGVFLGLKIDSEAPTSLKIGEHEGEGVFVVVTDDFVLKVADDCFLKLAEVCTYVEYQSYLAKIRKKRVELTSVLELIVTVLVRGGIDKQEQALEILEAGN